MQTRTNFFHQVACSHWPFKTPPIRNIDEADEYLFLVRRFDLFKFKRILQKFRSFGKDGNSFVKVTASQLE